MEISSEVIKILDYLGSKLGIAIDWTSQNMMPYLAELFDKFIAWEKATSITWIVILALILIGFFIAAIITNEEFLWLTSILIVVCFGAIIISQVFDVIECNVFPEKALYDYISMKLNGN